MGVWSLGSSVEGQLPWAVLDTSSPSFCSMGCPSCAALASSMLWEMLPELSPGEVIVTVRSSAVKEPV